MGDATIHGHCDDRFAAVRTAFEGNLAERGDIGAAVCLVVNGDVAVDLHGGWADADRTRPWAADTLVNVWSSTKGVVAVAAQVLVDRGQLDLDAPVAAYWPEFAAGGKEHLPVRYLLSHRAGLLGPREPITTADFEDWEKITGLLAGMEPWWEPGTQSGYHAITYGYLVGEVIRRICGRSVGNFVAEEIAGPLGADVHIGLGDAELDRCADLVQEPPPVGSDYAALFAQLEPAQLSALVNPPLAPPMAAAIANSEGWRRAEIPAANGHATARGLATVYAPLASGGEHAGVRLLSKEGAERIREGQGTGVDLVLGAAVPFDMTWGLGVVLSGDLGIYGPNSRAFGHDGYGGSFGMADPEAHLALAYTMNHMGPDLVGDPRKLALLDAVYSSL
jgi:CubicO group peptidase (beta-lactamase class C family)